MHHCKSYIKAIHTSISLLRKQFTICVLWNCVYCILCTIVYYLLYIVQMCILCKVCILLFVYCKFFILCCLYCHGTVLYLRISPSVHMCTWCVTIQRFDLIYIYESRVDFLKHLGDVATGLLDLLSRYI